jgi:hypothetical protein
MGRISIAHKSILYKGRCIFFFLVIVDHSASCDNSSGYSCCKSANDTSPYFCLKNHIRGTQWVPHQPRYDHINDFWTKVETILYMIPFDIFDVAPWSMFFLFSQVLAWIKQCQMHTEAMEGQRMMVGDKSKCSQYPCLV